MPETNKDDNKVEESRLAVGKEEKRPRQDEEI